MEYVATFNEDDDMTLPFSSTQPSHECNDEGKNEAIRPELTRYPYCIVWTPIPLLTWLLPFIGHVGICTSEGIIHDFAGSYYVSVDDFTFGEPYK